MKQIMYNTGTKERLNLKTPLDKDGIQEGSPSPKTSD